MVEGDLQIISRTLILPGFGGRTVLPDHEDAADGLHGYGVAATVQKIDWHAREDAIMSSVGRGVDEAAEEYGGPVDLVVTSAAGVPALLTMAEDLTVVDRVILLSSRVNDSDKPGLAKATAISPAFGKLLPRAQAAWARLGDTVRQRVTTARPRTGDLLVPEVASQLPKAQVLVFSYDAGDHHDGVRHGLHEGLGQIAAVLRKGRV